MKIKIHVDINTYEFVETELEGETWDELVEKAREFQARFHRLCTGDIEIKKEE